MLTFLKWIKAWKTEIVIPEEREENFSEADLKNSGFPQCHVTSKNDNQAIYEWIKTFGISQEKEEDFD